MNEVTSQIQGIIEKIGIDETRMYSKGHAEEIINKHVPSIYKGGIHVNENRMYTGFEIAEKIAAVGGNFVEAIDKVWKKNKKCQNL
ncbi:hypothetical protein CN918_31365 [Priestia megaterium]|nr:hypothetical protein CN918_31365 [Priestia megaterium]